MADDVAEIIARVGADGGLGGASEDDEIILSGAITDAVCSRTNGSGYVDVTEGDGFVASISLDDDGVHIGGAEGRGPTAWDALVNLAMIAGVWAPC
jgi:hypothetical protein